MRLVCANKIYIGWLLIVTILLMLFACNEGGSSTVRASNLKAITAFSFLSANGPVNGIITGQNIAVTMPYGTNITDLIATFTTTGTSVKVGNTSQVSGITPINFTIPVSYIVTAADGTTRNHTVTVRVAATPFVAYYPSGCTLGSNCTCIQDTTTHDIWTVSTSGNNQCYNSLMDANGTCPGYTTPSLEDYIPTLNSNNTCGFKSGWNLPSQTQLQKMANYVSSIANRSKADWFNSHGFSGIDNSGLYWGQCTDTSCNLPSGTSGIVWGMYMRNGSVSSTYSQSMSGYITHAWGVHSGQ